MLGDHSVLGSFDAANHDVVIRGCFDVDVVQTAAGTGNHFEPLGLFDHLPGHFAGGADNQGIHIADQVSDRFFRRLRANNDFGLAFKQPNAGFMDRLG